MSPRSIIIVLLAMSGSFTTILAVLGYAMGNDVQPRVRRERLVAPTSTTPISAAAEALANSTDMGQPVPDVPDAATTAPEVSDRLPPPEADAAGVELLARVTERRLQGVEEALAKQVKALRQSRDAMLDELASQLAAMTVKDAVATLVEVDDETVSLTLQRLPTPRRQAILRGLPAKRRTSLERLLAAR